MTGQNDRQDRSLTGQVRDQAGHCPLTGRYLQPWPIDVNVMLNLSTNPFSQTTVSDLKNWNYDNDDIKVFLEAKVTVSDCQNFLAV